MPSLALHLVWLAVTVLRFAGVAIVFAGVGLFGVYFIGGNARSSNGAVPASSWLGPGPRKGMKMVAFGAILLLGAYAIQFFLPDGT